MNIIEGNDVIQKEYVINLHHIDEPHKTHDVVRREIVKALDKFDINEDQMKKNITWISDRGGNIVKALSDCERMNCYAHLINNIVENMCSDQLIKTIISDAAGLVRYLKKSGIPNKNFQTALRSYIETRWNTVYYLLKSILDNYNSILQVLLDKERNATTSNVTLKLTCLPKEDMRNIAEFLKFFAEVTVHIQGEKFDTIYLIWPYFNRLKQHLRENILDSPIIKLMKSKGERYFQKNLTDFKPTITHKIAVFLHPGLKQLSCASSLEKEEIIEYVKSRIPNNFEIQNVIPEVNHNSVVSNVSMDPLFNEFIGEAYR